MNGSVIVDKWQINLCDIVWMHICVVLAIIVCCSSAPRWFTRSCGFFSSTHDSLWLCFCVCLFAFFCLAVWDVCVAHERLLLVDTEHAHTIVHLPFTGWGTFWYQVCDTSDCTIVSQDWKLFDPTHLLFIDSLNPFLELQHQIWTHSAQWTERGLSKDMHLFPTYRRSVSGQRWHHALSPHKKQHIREKRSHSFCLKCNMCLFLAQLCQRKAICTSWSPTPMAGWSVTL